MRNRFVGRKGARLLAIGVAVTALVLPLAACSSGSSGGSKTNGTPSKSGSQAEAQAAVQETLKPLSGPSGGSPIDVSSLRGKSIAFIATSGSDFGKTVAEGLQEAGAAVGITVLPYFGDGTLDTARTQIANAVTKGVSGIVLASWDPASLTDSLQAAASHGIKIVGLSQFDNNDQLSAAAKTAGMTAVVPTCYRCMGEAIANAVAANSGGRGDALFLNVPELPAAARVQAGFESELKKVCASCKVTTIDTSAASLQTQMPQAVSAALVKDPDLKFVIPVFDVYAPFFTSAIVSSGSGDRIKLMGADASRGPLLAMQKGTPPTWAYDNGYNLVEAGWASMDQIMRVILGQPPAMTALPNRGFTPDVVKGMDPNAFPNAWFGATPNYFRDGYLKLWKMS